MMIIVTKKGNIATISNEHFQRGIRQNNLQFAYRDSIPEKEIRLQDIKELFDVGDLQRFVNRYPKQFLEMIEEHKKNNHKSDWDFN